MSKLESRLLGAVEFMALPHPKRVTRHRGLGVVRGGFVGTSDRGAPILWRETPKGVAGEVLKLPGHKTARPQGARGDRIVGCYDDSTGSTERIGAVTWTVSEDGLRHEELPGAGLAKWSAAGCDERTVVGSGTPHGKPMETLDRGLVWRDGRVDVIEAREEVRLTGVDGDDVVGSIGRNAGTRAALWRSGSLLRLAPDDDAFSKVLFARDGQQVGQVWKKRQLAVVWAGSASSMVDLTPPGHEVAWVWSCARGLQVGHARTRDATRKGEASLEDRALLWAGSATDVLDLQAAVPAPWNASNARAMEVDGDRVTVVGSVHHVEDPAGSPRLVAYAAAVWRLRLRM